MPWQLNGREISQYFQYVEAVHLWVLCSDVHTLLAIYCRSWLAADIAGHLSSALSDFIGLNWTVNLSYIRLINALKTLSCTQSVLSWPLTGNICLCVYPMGWGERGMGCSEGCQILSSAPKQTHPSPGGYSQSGKCAVWLTRANSEPSSRLHVSLGVSAVYFLSVWWNFIIMFWMEIHVNLWPWFTS